MAKEEGGAGKTIMIVLVVVGALLFVCGGGCCLVSYPFMGAGAKFGEMTMDVAQSRPGTTLTMLPDAPGSSRLYLVAITAQAETMSEEELAAFQDELWTMWSDAFTDGGAFPVVGVGVGVPGGPQGVTNWTERTVDADVLVERTGKPKPESSFVFDFMPADSMAETTTEGE